MTKISDKDIEKAISFVQHFGSSVQQALDKDLFSILADGIQEKSKSLKFTKIIEAFDRVYIQDYINLQRNKGIIKGKILEWGGSNILYSNPAEENVTICTGMKDQSKDATVAFDILRIETIPSELLLKFDTIICTQVLNYMLDPVTAIKNMYWLLKEGGNLILTVSGPCYRDRNSEGFKSFWTERGVKDMCKIVFGEEHITKPRVYGDFEGAINALLGNKANNTINKKKTDFNVITGITCRKEINQ